MWCCHLFAVCTDRKASYVFTGLIKKLHLFIRPVLRLFVYAAIATQSAAVIGRSSSNCRWLALDTRSRNPLPAMLRIIITRTRETKLSDWRKKKCYLWEGSWVAYQNNYFNTDVTQLYMETHFISWPISGHYISEECWTTVWFIAGDQINNGRFHQRHRIFRDGIRK